MNEKVVEIKGDAGVHARPAMMLVKEAQKYSCDITLIKEGFEADCKSIMSVLGLAIISGTRLTVRASGTGENSAVDSIVSMIENNFNPHEENIS